MINAGLSLNKNNRIVALLWHQGEHDTYENAQFSYDERDNPLNRFTTDVIQQKVIQFRRRNSRQSARNNLKRIGDCYTSAFLAVINRKYSH